MKKSTFLLTSTLMCASIFAGCDTNKDVSVSNQKNAAIEAETTEVPTTDDVQETKEPINVTENTLYFSCNTNEENTPGYVPGNEAEGEGMDCFFVSGEYLFLDDTVGNRILVYKDFVYDHEIPLSENQDVQDMFYDSESNILKTIYENKNNTDATHYHYMEISVENSSITTDKELSNAKKILIASDPKAALRTQACAEKAFKWTESKFGYNGNGDKSDGYRHACWNALMTRDIGREWAEAYATAHEDKSKKELEKKESDGYKKKKHRKMDLHNNKVGRDCVKWYDVWPVCSNKKLKKRVSAKLTNDKDTGIYWLHK